MGAEQSTEAPTPTAAEHTFDDPVAKNKERHARDDHQVHDTADREQHAHKEVLVYADAFQAKTEAHRLILSARWLSELKVSDRAAEAARLGNHRRARR